MKNKVGVKDIKMTVEDWLLFRSSLVTVSLLFSCLWLRYACFV